MNEIVVKTTFLSYCLSYNAKYNIRHWIVKKIDTKYLGPNNMFIKKPLRIDHNPYIKAPDNRFFNVWRFAVHKNKKAIIFVLFMR
jgi:hypothetical protein